MTIAVAAAVACLGVATAVGHSLLGERRLLHPLFAEADARGGVLRSRASRAILRAVFHLPSVAWAVLGIATLLARAGGGNPLLETVAAIIFAVSGVANLAALRRPHPGGLMMLAAAGLTVADARWLS